jgi:Bacterial regulatory helix-turn-helix protein, lysR family
VRAAELGSFTLASEKLRISPSALSGRVAQLVEVLERCGAAGVAHAALEGRTRRSSLSSAAGRTGPRL